ncbi:DEAD/DEAH box helicase [Nocardioides pacificus]
MSAPAFAAPASSSDVPSTDGPTDGPAIDAGSTAFSDLPDALIAALAVQGITAPTSVQAAVIPDARAGHDLLGRAQTGSGKTLAFGLPVLARLAGERSRPNFPRSIIVVPTRELAQQVSRALHPLANSLNLKMTTVYGGTPYDRQVRALRNRADIVVATPGRLDDLIKQGHCKLDDIQITVLDEADHLCDLGFYPAIDKLVGMTPAGSQRMLLSATLDGDVDRLVRKHLRDPKVHQLDPNAGAVTTMTHHTMVVGGFRDKVDAAVKLVTANGRTILFTRTRDGAVELAEALTAAGVEAVDLHGNLSQRVRERNLHKFSSGKVQAVVATDVAARGIHVDGIDLVIHFDQANDPKAYLHRSGRTARAGTSGCVITISTPKFVDQLVRLQRNAGVEVRHHDIRTAPQPMTAEALSTSGDTTAPRPSSSSSGSRRPQGGRSSYAGGSRRPEGRSGRSDSGRNDSRGHERRRSF